MRPVVAAFTAALALWGCDRGVRLEPPVIHAGQDVCSQCSMIVNEERFAAAEIIAAEDAESAVLLFDDISCLFARERSAPNDQVLARWVRDATGRGWIDASSAYFVKSDQIRSPMGGGTLASASLRDAETLREKTPGEIYSLEKLRPLFKNGG